MRVRTIFALWLPLAISFELMMLEGPTVQGAMGRLAAPELHLAAWGLTMSLSLLIESPVIMLLATAIALVQDADSYHALRRFMLTLAGACTLLTALIAFTPLFDLIAGGIMGQPLPIVAAARPAMQIMLLWTAAIAWRRFYQGVLVRYGQTRRVSWGTAVRLSVVVCVATALSALHRVPGVQVGAYALMAAVIAEAFATTLFALPIIRGQGAGFRSQGLEKEEKKRRREEKTETNQSTIYNPQSSTDSSFILHPSSLSQREIWKFHAPLAATTLLTLLAQPMTAAALARLPNKTATLAVWPVVSMLLLVMRGWGLALQEITVSQAKNPASHAPLRRFTLLVGLTTTLATALIAFTPLLNVYVGSILHLPPDLHQMARIGIGAGVLLPLLSSLSAWAGGLIVAKGQTHHRYKGMGLNLGTHITLLFFGVGLRLPGIWVAAGAFTAAALAEYVYLNHHAKQA